MAFSDSGGVLMRSKRFWAIVLVGAALATSWIILAPASGQEESPIDYTTIDPFPASFEALDWGESLAFVESRVRDWYAERDVATLTTEELVAGIEETSWVMATRPEEFENELYWLRELQLRREVLCQALPPNHDLRSDYCSSTSFPGFDVTAR